MLTPSTIRDTLLRLWWKLHLSIPLLSHFFAAVTAIFCTLWLLTTILQWTVNIARGLRQRSVFLEVTPPQATPLSQDTTSELFGLISGLVKERAWSDFVTYLRSLCAQRSH